MYLINKIEAALQKEPWLSMKEIAHKIGTTPNAMAVTCHNSGMKFSEMRREIIKKQITELRKA